MNDNSLFRDPDGDPEPQNPSGAAGQQGSKAASDSDSPAEEGEQPGPVMFAQEQAQPREQLIDEAIEETFPASDPPFWMPFGR
jgi:hypothetical protein